MKKYRLLRKIAVCVFGLLVGSLAAKAQSAQGSLRVQVSVQTSVAIVQENGEWRIVVANAPDPADNVSRLIPAERESQKSVKLGANAPHFHQPAPQVQEKAQSEFLIDGSHRGY